MAQESSQFFISYDGSALQTHEMDVKDLAPALLAIGELLEEANRALNGEDIKVRVNIRAPQPGSVEVFFSVVQDFLSQTMSLLNGEFVNSIINGKELVALLGLGGGGGVVALLKWLRNRKIKNIIKVEIDKYKIELDDGEIKIITQNEIKLFSLLNIRKKFEAIIRGPLQKPGINQIKFKDANSEQVIRKEETEYFATPIITEEIIDEREIETNLQIVNVSFQEDGKWKFFDGSTCFFANILDKEFMDKIQKNEKYFAKDDLLNVILKRVQSIENGSIKNSYEILRVLKHRSAAVQIKLPFASD